MTRRLIPNERSSSRGSARLIYRVRHHSSEYATLASIARARLGLRTIGLQLAALCQVACGTSSSSGDGWAYLGSNATLRSPVPAMSPEQSHEQRLKLAQESLEAWKRRVCEAVAADKTGCAIESGEPATPNTLFGYGKAFEGCMRKRSWQRGSNPL